jgi:hypothetical protein
MCQRAAGFNRTMELGQTAYQVTYFRRLNAKLLNLKPDQLEVLAV